MFNVIRMSEYFFFSMKKMLPEERFQNPESRIHFANDGDDDGEKIHSMKMFVNRIECRSKQEK